MTKYQIKLTLDDGEGDQISYLESFSFEYTEKDFLKKENELRDRAVHLMNNIITEKFYE